MGLNVTDGLVIVAAMHRQRETDAQIVEAYLVRLQAEGVAQIDADNLAGLAPMIRVGASEENGDGG